MILLGILLWSCTLFCNEHSILTKDLPLTPGSTFNLTIHVNNSHEAKSNNSTTVSPSQLIKEGGQNSPLINKLVEFFDIKSASSLKERMGNSGASFLNNYKWHLLGATIVCSYSYLFYFLFTGNLYLANNDLWSSWRQELPLDQLLAIPQSQFAQELLREIQRRYTDVHSITDLVRPLSIFMTTIDQEEEQIKWYQTGFSWISYLRLAKLVPVSKARFGKLAERLQRIAYYKNTFKSWAADYQLEQVSRALMQATQPLSPQADMVRLAMNQCLIEHWKKRIKALVPAYCA